MHPRLLSTDLEVAAESRRVSGLTVSADKQLKNRVSHVAAAGSQLWGGDEEDKAASALFSSLKATGYLLHLRSLITVLLRSAEP